MNELIKQFNDKPGTILVASLGGILGISSALLYYKFNGRKSTPYIKDYEKGLVYLFQFSRSKFLPNFSPFCLKLETWLRIAGIPYKNVENLPILLRSREGTRPFVELDGVEYCDSSLIIRDLTQVLQKEAVETQLSVEQRAVGRSLENLAETSLLPTSAYFRLPFLRDTLKLSLNPMPTILLPIITVVLVRYMKKKLFYMGISKHPDHEIQYICEQDLLALSNYLGSKHYFSGFKATKVDATIFAVLAFIIYCPYESPQRTFIRANCPNLEEFCDRIKKRFWPDWDDLLAGISN